MQPDIYDSMLSFHELRKFIVATDRCALLRGPFVSLHFQQYSYLAGSMEQPEDLGMNCEKIGLLLAIHWSLNVDCRYAAAATALGLPR